MKHYMKHLSEQDEVMKMLINKFGEINVLDYKKNDINYFEELVYIIIGQQLSSKAANTIRNNLKKEISEINPEIVLSVESESFYKSGVSKPKTLYIKNLAKKINEEEIVFQEIINLDSELIITELTKIKGIGRWTVEMFLIFVLKKENIFSFGDKGLSNSINSLYGPDISENQKKKIINKWSPYKSYASIYLWKYLDNWDIFNVASENNILKSHF